MYVPGLPVASLARVGGLAGQAVPGPVTAAAIVAARPDPGAVVWLYEGEAGVPENLGVAGSRSGATRLVV